jgi:hypothetical protein
MSITTVLEAKYYLHFWAGIVVHQVDQRQDQAVLFAVFARLSFLKTEDLEIPFSIARSSPHQEARPRSR